MQASRDTVAIGVIGGGLVAQVVHLPALAELADLFDLRAVADPSERVRASLSARYGPIRAHADWRDVIEDESLAAVAICSPPATHAEMTLAALDAGLHVFVEKPLSITMGDSEAICERTAERGLVTQVGYMKRFDRGYELLLDRLPADGTGLRFVDVVTYDPWMARPPFITVDLVRADDIPKGESRRVAQAERDQVEAAIGSADEDAVRAFGTTYLAALIHDVNLVHGVLEHLRLKTPGVALASRHWAEGNAVNAIIDIEGFAAWQSAWLLLPGVMEFRESASFFFEDEIHRLDLPAPYLQHLPSRYSATLSENGQRQRVDRVRRGDGFIRAWRHFHDCVVAGATCRTPPEQARDDIALLTDLFIARTTADRIVAT
jgi:predicted dehydrogenase